MADYLIKSMDEPWNPEAYRDTYIDRVNELIEAKRQGNEVRQLDEALQPTNVIDLFETLQRSVESATAANRRSSGAADSSDGVASGASA